jgi:hypothetical protein
MKKVFEQIEEAEKEMFNSAKKFCDLFNNDKHFLIEDFLEQNKNILLIKYEDGQYIPDKILIKSAIYKLIEEKKL